MNTSVFVKSSPKIGLCPSPDKPEFAFIGRSNVGKSSLINALTDNSKLAKISSKPGKTKLINHFLINDEWYLVDLPGYGWAKVS
ncbi:MAG: 50S ribosome-binding GTPase, partial [Cyclobacteriaceae bacterium]|nr:50S ribosome-binding GTPase [Cyclobacteriaceae bacterium]